MNVVELIDRAGMAAGSLAVLANSMHKHPARISEWKSGKRKPDAAEVAYMAKVAGLPVLITVAMVEAELHPETRELWEQALGEIEARPAQSVAPVRYRAMVTDTLARLADLAFGAWPRLGFA